MIPGAVKTSEGKMSHNQPEALVELTLSSPSRPFKQRDDQKNFCEKKLEFSSGDEADDSTCAICLNRIPHSEVAQPVGCDHIYCTCCILHWACFKEKPWCPQCKIPFSSLLTFRTLDGELHDYPCQEPIALLRCTPWFQDHIKMRESLIAAANAKPVDLMRGSVIDESDFQDYARYYQEYDDDEEVEDYFYSSAAGRARIVLGNRRHGPNGFMRSGRQQARPAPPPAKTIKGKAKTPEGNSGTSKASSNTAQTSSSSTPKPAPGRASSSKKKKKPSIRLDDDDESGDDFGSKSNSVGRRARRNQRRAAADARGGL